MTCRNTTCRYEFCWICMKPWRTHDASNCKTRVEEEANNQVCSRKLNDKFHTQRKYEEYLGQYKRFSNKLTDDYKRRLQHAVQQKADQLMEHDEQHLARFFDALRILQKAQRVLTYSCVFSFYVAHQDFQTACEFGAEVEKLNVAAQALEQALMTSPIGANPTDWIATLAAWSSTVELQCAEVLQKAPDLSDKQTAIGFLRGLLRATVEFFHWIINAFSSLF